jgi:hypothetical protein
MAAKQKGVKLEFINAGISKGGMAHIKEDDEFCGSKAALTDDSLNCQEDPRISGVLMNDQADNAEGITTVDETVNSLYIVPSSNTDISAPAVLVINSDAIKSVSFRKSGEKDKSDKPPTSSNEMNVLEVDAELSKHNLPSVELNAVSLEESNQNGEACRASRDKTGIRKTETENDGCDGGYAPGETSRIMRNVIVIGTAFMVHFTAFCGTSNLQSSINADEGLGTVSLMSIFISMMISTIFLPVIVIRLVIPIVF